MLRWSPYIPDRILRQRPKHESKNTESKEKKKKKKKKKKKEKRGKCSHT